MLKTLNPGKCIFVFLIITLAGIFSSCTEKISGVGSTYLRDTISSGIHTYSDTSGFNFSPFVKHTVIASTGISYGLTLGTQALLLGSTPGDITKSCIGLQIPIFPDSVGRILADTLILKMRYPYHYGNPSNQTIDFWVYASTDGSVNDSTQFLTPANLGTIVGSFSSVTAPDSLVTAVIPLDTGILSHPLRTASLGLVLVPKPDMQTIRAFASINNGDNTFSPTLKLFTQRTSATDTVTLFTNPSNNFYVVAEGSPVPPNEFILRGSYAERERIVINIKNIRAQLQLNPFTTINSAVLQVRSDAAYRTQSDVPVDTTGPSLVYIPNTVVADSGHAFISYGTSATTDTTLYGFQIRSNVENSLRVGDDSLVLELRAGFISRTIFGSAVDVEDYTIDRWMMYGMNYPDPTKRPKLIITYSYLK